ncbi:MAG: type II toxin-antitoxin system RelE/ParE family toxin [Candidatus Hydrogenedentes bacterium]|nr:type II toxin-antitoxin system RelE/ParE family toxin [Candidatus Hydrogenedentota bacterium]
MPNVHVVFYREADGAVPVLEWLDGLPEKALDKCVVRIERLAELGHELRRPEADYLREGIYELRTHFQMVNYRILYFLHRRGTAVLVHALTKKEEIPARDIELAVRRKRRFEAEPKRHTAEE